MPLNKVIFNNNSQNKDSFLKKGTPQGPKPIEENKDLPIISAEQTTEQIVSTASFAFKPTPVGSKPNILGPNIAKSTGVINFETPIQSKNKLSSKLINYVEPYEIGGVRKTAFYSENSTNFKVGDKVFIINGNYDSHDKILNDKYSKGSDGYKVLSIEDCKIVLDIDYTNQKPYESPLNIDDLIFVHSINNQEIFDYISIFKTYVSDVTIPGELVSYFQGRVVSNILRTWTGNIIYVPQSYIQNGYSDIGVLELNPTGLYSTPNAAGFWVRDSLTANGTWVNVSTQIESNQIRLMDIFSNPTNLTGDKRLFILGEDFTWKGTKFQERQIYKFDTTTSKWIIDRQYKIPIITSTYFKYGKFTGVHNGGVFGTYLKENKWNNATWNYGVMINTVWNNGLMNTNTKVGERVVKASLLYDQLSVPYISQVVDTTNNSGYGYNLVIDSQILKGVFLQSTFENCNLGSAIPNDVLSSYYQKIQFPSNITANFSKFQFCDLDSAILSSSILFDSIVKNSNIRLTKSVNSQIFKSVFDGGEFNSDSGVKIIGAELNSWDGQLSQFNTMTELVGILKLFISDEDFFRMEKNDSFYIERVNKEFFLGGLNTDNRIILPYETKYLLNLYWDVEFSDRQNYKHAVSIRDKRSNRNRFYVRRSTNAQTITLNCPRTTPSSGNITYWLDVTSRFSQTSRISPGYDSTWLPSAPEVQSGVWFYYSFFVPGGVGSGGSGGNLPTLPEIGEETPVLEDPGNTNPSQTTYIFKYSSVPSTQPVEFSNDGYTPLSPEYTLAFINTVGPYESTSPGQFRGEYTTLIPTNPGERTPILGDDTFQINDVVRFYNPQTEKWEYFQCLVAHDPSLVLESYISRTFTIGPPSSKVLISETSKFKDYCSIDIESRVFGWYRDLDVNKDLYTFNKVPNGQHFKPDMNPLLPINSVDVVFKNILIKNSNFHSGVFINSKWVSGSLIEDFDQIIQNNYVSENLNSGRKASDKLNMRKTLSGKLGVVAVQKNASGGVLFTNPTLRRFNTGDFVFINSITYQIDGNRFELGGKYTYDSFDSTLKEDLFIPVSWEPSGFNSISEFGDPFSFDTLRGTYSIVGAPSINYATINRVIIQNSTVYSGVFKRVYFENTTLTNRTPYVKPSTLDIDPKALPKVVNVVFSRNNINVENGFIFRSHILNLTNTGGIFHSCYWNGATFSNGEFQSGYWIDGNFQGGKFLDSNELAYVIKNDPYTNAVADENGLKTIDIYSSQYGYFETGRNVIRKLWKGGVFGGGEFYNSYWIDGTFSNGKFWRSRWFAGDWNSGIFGDPSIKYEETNMGNGWYGREPSVVGINIVWNPTLVQLDSYGNDRIYIGRTQSKFFGGVVQNGQIGGNGVVFWYNGQMSAGEFTSASASVNNQSIWHNGTFYGSIFSKYAQWKNGIFNSGKFQSIYGYENQYLAHQPSTTCNYIFYPSYGGGSGNPLFAWQDGTFNGGEFGLGLTGVNSNWLKGNFNGGIFQGRIWADGVFSAGIFLGSGKIYSSGTPSDASNAAFLGEENNSRENEFYLSFRPLEDPLTPDIGLGSFYGLWLNGVVTDKRSQYIALEKVSTKNKRSNLEFESKNRVKFENMVWMDGLFDHETSEIENSLFLQGTFSNGRFNGGVFNPYVSRYDPGFTNAGRNNSSFIPSIINSSFGDPVFQPGNFLTNFNFASQSNINWTRGIFVTGSFYAATWQNGTFQNGYISGAYWKNGVMEYGTAENIFWDGGTWKNGNWNGSPFTHLVVATGPTNPREIGYSHSMRPGRAREIILRTDLFMRTAYKDDFRITDGNNRSYLFMSNVFSASPNTYNFGLDKIPMMLHTGDFHDIWLPYRTDSTNPPIPVTWTSFMTSCASTGVSFSISVQTHNGLTHASGGIDSNTIAGIWNYQQASVRETIAVLSGINSTTTPQQFINLISGFTWSGLFRHEAEIYNFQGNQGVKIRFYDYKNHPYYSNYQNQGTINVGGGNSLSFNFTLDLKRNNKENYGWVTSSHFNIFENHDPFPPKPEIEYYDARDFDYTQPWDKPSFVISQKPRTDWEVSEGIPFYWDGTFVGVGNNRKPNVSVTKVGGILDGKPRNYINLSTSLSEYSGYSDPNYGLIPAPQPLTLEQVRKNPLGYNTFQKEPEEIASMPWNNISTNIVVPPFCRPSMKIYPRFQTGRTMRFFKFYSRYDCAQLIAQINSVVGNTTFLPFNGVTGSRVGFYVNDLNDPYVGPFCNPAAGGQSCYNEILRFEQSPPTSTLSNASFTSATDAEIDALVLYLRETFEGTRDSIGTGAFISGYVNRTGYGFGGMTVFYGIENYFFPLADNQRPFAFLQANLAGANTTPIEYEGQSLYYLGADGVNLFQSPFNFRTQSYDIRQYTVTIELSVELEKQVSVDIFFAGLSYSTYTLKSKECTIDGTLLNPGQKQTSYFPAFYRIKLDYLTSPQNVFTGLATEGAEDNLKMWFRTSSPGILRIYSWTVRQREIFYDSEYNNSLYQGVDQSQRFVGLPATSSVVLNIPTDTDKDNSIVFGNGIFRQGVWENGVWNGGYRLNSELIGFFEGDDMLKGRELVFAVRTTSKDTLWSIKIQLIDNLSAYKLKLDVGSKIAVSNLAAYDNNGRRIIISSVLDVQSYSFDENTITVIYKSMTPISYIKKDSENHLIYVTTNIWTNGVFLNGVFRGIWNNGLFKGEPYLTKMVDSHFVDGAFEGGHFKSVEQVEGVTPYGKHNTGLIQNFRFKDLNVTKPNPKYDSYYISDIFNSYRSYIDVVYSTQSKVNLKSDTTQLRVKEFIPLMIGSSKADALYFSNFAGQLADDGINPNLNIGGWKSRLSSSVINQPNLQGLPTVDVLSSTSEFRDYLTTTNRTYRLGTKRRVFDNLLPDSGNFVKPITSNATSSSQINIIYPGLFAPTPNTTNLTIPFFTTTRNITSYGYTFSFLWQRVGKDYIPPGYEGSPPKTWIINQVGHGDLDKPLTYEPKELTVTFGDNITFRLNDLRKPNLVWGYQYNALQSSLSFTGHLTTPENYAQYKNNPYNVNDAQKYESVNSMYPWQNYTFLGQSLVCIPFQLNSTNQTITNQSSHIFGWNSYNPLPSFNTSLFGDNPTPTGTNRNSSPLGNRVILSSVFGAGFEIDPLNGAAGDLAWGYTDAGYAYPQERTINTKTGIRTTYVDSNGNVTAPWGTPVSTSQNGTRTGPDLVGIVGNTKTPGLTHGVHFFINANRLIASFSNVLSKTWSASNIAFPSPYSFYTTQRKQNIINSWGQELRKAGLNGDLRFNPTSFNPSNAFGKITVLQVPSPVWTKSLPANYYYDSNTNPNTDNILRLTISDYLVESDVDKGPLNWIQIFQNKSIRPIPNRYYELSVDIVYNLTEAPVYDIPRINGKYQGLFLDDIFENLDQDSDNAGLPQHNLHQYLNHFGNGKYDKFNKKLTVTSTEYFMNKTNMDVIFYNTYPTQGGPLTIDYKNISLKEVDMLPFFCYFSQSIYYSDVYLQGNSNKSNGRAPFIPHQIDITPRIPLQASAPFIDTTNSNFSFTDNIDLKISSKFIQQNSKVVVPTNELSVDSFEKSVPFVNEL
jgi:hypothetical protein